jgi:hypothetical protein
MTIEQELDKLQQLTVSLEGTLNAIIDCRW